MGAIVLPTTTTRQRALAIREPQERARVDCYNFQYRRRLQDAQREENHRVEHMPLDGLVDAKNGEAKNRQADVLWKLVKTHGCLLVETQIIPNGMHSDRALYPRKESLRSL